MSQHGDTFNKQPITVTDPSLRPSERFIELLKPYFESRGYKFKKSARQFEIPFDFGAKIVWVSFLNYSGLIAAELFFRISYFDLEKVRKRVFNFTGGYKGKKTLGSDILNFKKAKLKEPSNARLHDSNHHHTDIQLNSASATYIRWMEEYVNPFFEQFNNYHDLHGFLMNDLLDNRDYVQGLDDGLWYRAVLDHIIGGTAIDKAVDNSIETLNKTWSKVDDHVCEISKC